MTNGAPGIKSTGSIPSERSGETIVALVNDDPISQFDVDQRINLLLLSSNEIGEYVKKNAQDRWARIVKDPSTNTEFQAFMKKHSPKSQAEAATLQRDFATAKQKVMVEELRREARNKVKGTAHKDALEELISERLKLAEAKRLNIVTSDADVTAIVLDVAKRYNKSEREFADMMRGMGIDLKTMRDQYRAMLAWRDVIRRQYGYQISIGTRDIDRAITAAGGAAADGTQTEFELHKISLPLPPKSGEAAKNARIAEAEAMRAKFTSCKMTSTLTPGIEGARFENLGPRTAAQVPVSVRAGMQTAKVNEMLPPAVVDTGIELYAVCARNERSVVEKKREEVSAELRSQEFELLARKHLKKLRQDSQIEYRK